MIKIDEGAISQEIEKQPRNTIDRKSQTPTRPSHQSYTHVQLVTAYRDPEPGQVPITRSNNAGRTRTPGNVTNAANRKCTPMLPRCKARRGKEDRRAVNFLQTRGITTVTTKIKKTLEPDGAGSGKSRSAACMLATVQDKKTSRQCRWRSCCPLSTLLYRLRAAAAAPVGLLVTLQHQLTLKEYGDVGWWQQQDPSSPSSFRVEVRKRGDWARGSRGGCFPEGCWRFGEQTAGRRGQADRADNSY
jgi:hypothetical protein